MAPVSGINGSEDLYGKIASGNRIERAKDDAAGLTISENMKEQENGLNAATQNAKHGVDALNIADGALAQINDNLQRIYELSVKASNNFMYSPGELNAMQKEIDGLMKGIEDIAKGTEYNTMKLLDGNMADMDLATNPDGSGQKIQMANATLEALGIDGYDVTGKFDITRISDAIDKVNESRSEIGAKTNALEYTINRNELTAENTMAARSQLADLDIPQAISEQKKNQVLDDYQMMMQRQKMKDEEEMALGLFRF
ncbi:MAG: flagellin FliC5 [Lachnospiraceae bacterium]|nr:flagellin FliC5 [Lachnospiraceae bacterium]